MARTVEDQVEDQVRRRITDLLASAGVSRSRINLEVLYMLPPEFVRMYVDLFDRALGDPISRAGDGGKDEGRIKASGKSKDPMRARSRAGAQGGKRFVAGSWPVKSEAALEEKRKLDRSLVRGVERALRAAGSMGAGKKGSSKLDPPRCGTCGRIQSNDWLRCPFHG